MGFKISTLNSFPCNANPFNHDAYNMGAILGTNCTVMYENHSDARCKYLILVNTATGERVRVDFEPDFYGKLADEIQWQLTQYGNLKEDEELRVGLNDGKIFGWSEIREE